MYIFKKKTTREMGGRPAEEQYILNPLIWTMIAIWSIIELIKVL